MTSIDPYDELPTLLETIPAFAGCDAELLREIRQAAYYQRYTSGQMVFQEGDPSLGLYLVHQGWLKAVKISPSGREQTLRLVGPRDIFNELSMLVNMVNQASVIALESSLVWCIPRDHLLQTLDNHPRLGRVLIQNLAERILHLLNLVEDLSLRSVESRLARLLLTQASADRVQRPRWSTQAELATQLGTVPDVLNRALRNLSDAGLILVERQQIQILDRQGLEDKVNNG